VATARPWDKGRQAIIEERVSLSEDTQSPRAARRLLRKVLADAGRSEWTDTGELAISELVTNAVLHAHTAIDLTVALFDDRVCCEVRDYNPAAPAARGYDEQASTGRGLDLVAAVASDYGMESYGPSGKAVWFCIGSGSETDGAEAWDLDVTRSLAQSEAPTVVLQGLPPTLWLATRQHHDAQLRELALRAAEHPVDVDFETVDRARMAIADAVARALDAAFAEGRVQPVLPDGHPSPLPWAPKSVDAELHLTPVDGPAFLALPDALDLAERLSVSGDLLNNPGLPEIIALRDWACEQVVAQLGGSPPGPWPGTAQERFETAAHAPAMVDESAWNSASVREADRGVVAADDANRIVAISRPLAEAVGWEPEALVGRRVVTLIPPRLREAHVAGFSRHLSTGEAHVLGVPLELPVLRSDGSEILCRFMIERVSAGASRTIYVAWIEPLPS
jgi:PAS domain S-box-containing protein